MRLALILGRGHAELVVLKELSVLDMGTARRMLGMYGAGADVGRHHGADHRVGVIHHVGPGWLTRHVGVTGHGAARSGSGARISGHVSGVTWPHSRATWPHHRPHHAPGCHPRVMHPRIHAGTHVGHPRHRVHALAWSHPLTAVLLIPKAGAHVRLLLGQEALARSPRPHVQTRASRASGSQTRTEGLQVLLVLLSAVHLLLMLLLSRIHVIVVSHVVIVVVVLREILLLLLWLLWKRLLLLSLVLEVLWLFILLLRHLLLMLLHFSIHFWIIDMRSLIWIIRMHGIGIINFWKSTSPHTRGFIWVSWGIGNWIIWTV